VKRFLAGTEKSPIFQCCWCPGRVVCGYLDGENRTKWILDILCEEQNWLFIRKLRIFIVCNFFLVIRTLCTMLCLYEEFVFDEELLYLAMSKSGHPVEIVSFDYVSSLL
jgi:hypothetical protein